MKQNNVNNCVHIQPFVNSTFMFINLLFSIQTDPIEISEPLSLEMKKYKYFTFYYFKSWRKQMTLFWIRCSLAGHFLIFIIDHLQMMFISKKSHQDLLYIVLRWQSHQYDTNHQVCHTYNYDMHVTNTWPPATGSAFFGCQNKFLETTDISLNPLYWKYLINLSIFTISYPRNIEW